MVDALSRFVHMVKMGAYSANASTLKIAEAAQRSEQSFAQIPVRGTGLGCALNSPRCLTALWMNEIHHFSIKVERLLCIVWHERG